MHYKVLILIMAFLLTACGNGVSGEWKGQLDDSVKVTAKLQESGDSFSGTIGLIVDSESNSNPEVLNYKVTGGGIAGDTVVITSLHNDGKDLSKFFNLDLTKTEDVLQGNVNWRFNDANQKHSITLTKVRN